MFSAMSACLRDAFASSAALAGIHLHSIAKVGEFSLTTGSLDSFKVHCSRVLAQLMISVRLVRGNLMTLSL